MIGHIPVTPRAPLAIEACLQSIASAAHLRGVVTNRQGAVVAEIPAVDLMRALRGAWTKVTDVRRQQVETIIRTTALRVRSPGPVQIARSVLGICVAYAGLAPKKADRQQGKRRAAARNKRRAA